MEINSDNTLIPLYGDNLGVCAHINSNNHEINSGDRIKIYQMRLTNIHNITQQNNKAHLVTNTIGIRRICQQEP